MEFEKYSELRKCLKKELDKNRYKHTINVAYTATCLAMRYDIDLDKAYLAGLLHDCAKCIPDKKKYELCEKYSISLTDSEKANPSLIHSKLGPYIAAAKYGVTDKEVLNSIEWHTTGKEDMSVLEKIIFIADYIEPGRNKQINLSQIRKEAFIDLDETMYLITRDTLEYLLSMQGIIDGNTRKAFEFYEKIHKAGEKNND